jgi:anti-sigma factor RsiW
MNCKECLNEIDELLDGRLAPDAAAILRDHLAACPSCAAVWRDHEAAWQAFVSAPELEPSSNFTARVLNALDAAGRETAASSPAFPWPWLLDWRWVRLGSAALVAVAVVGLGIWQQQLASREQAAHQELLSELPVVQHLDLLKDLDVIKNLDQLAPPANMDLIEELIEEILNT